MIITFLLLVMMMVGFFLLLLAGVGFVQDKKFFSSAPKEVLKVIQPKKERFSGQHAIGWIMIVIAILLMVSSIVIGAVDGIQNSFTFVQYFTRFMIIFLSLKAFDIIFFDWVLLCNSGFRFFERYYPEVESVLSPKLFGYNKKEHLIHVIGMILGSVVLAYICTLF